MSRANIQPSRSCRLFGIEILVVKYLGFAALFLLISLPITAQQTSTVVQPGAPGEPTKVLPSTTRAELPPTSRKDVEFMQGMIMHHAQAVEMVALIEGRSENNELRLLGARISHSQADEMRFMQRWLLLRGESTTMPMPKMSGMRHDHKMMLMPGMLSPEQMDVLRDANGAEFDRLFLEGMIQHHRGALTMVEDLYASAGAGQDAELFSFASEIDSGQRAEIRVMQGLLGEKP